MTKSEAIDGSEIYACTLVTDDDDLKVAIVRMIEQCDFPCRLTEAGSPRKMMEWSPPQFDFLQMLEAIQESASEVAWSGSDFEASLASDMLACILLIKNATTDAEKMQWSYKLGIVREQLRIVQCEKRGLGETIRTGRRTQEGLSKGRGTREQESKKRHKRMCERFREVLRSGVSKTQAYDDVAKEFDVEQRTIQRAVSDAQKRHS